MMFGQLAVFSQTCQPAKHSKISSYHFSNLTWLDNKGEFTSEHLNTFLPHVIDMIFLYISTN